MQPPKSCGFPPEIQPASRSCGSICKLRKHGIAPIQDIDYERYAKGEAFLGWLNAECRMETGNGGIPMDEVSEAMGEEIRRRQVERSIEIAHLKVSVVDALGETANGGGRDLSVVQCVSSAAAVSRGRVLINLRAQAEPGTLESDVRAAVDAVAKRWDVQMTMVRLDSFAPSAPNPPFEKAVIPPSKQCTCGEIWRLGD